MSTTTEKNNEQKKIFDELCGLVLEINEADSAEQGKLINAFSQKLDKALSSNFNFFEEFEIDPNYTKTTAQFIIQNSNNQQCIETFFSKILSTIEENKDNIQHVLDNVKYNCNLYAVKALFAIIEKKEVDTELRDTKVSEITTYLFNNVISPKGDRQQQVRNDNYLDELERAKEILEFFQTVSKDEKISSSIKNFLSKANEYIKREKNFVEFVPSAEQSYVDAGNPASSEAHTTHVAPTAPPQVEAQSNLPPVNAGSPAFRETGPTQHESPAIVPASSSAKPTPGTPTAPPALGPTQEPTFFDENKGKIAAGLAVASLVLAACAFIPGLPFEAVCGVIIAGAVAILAAGKMAYDKVSERAEKDGKGMWEATKSLLTDMMPECVKSQKNSQAIN
jgi:hypothetical protein